MRENLNVESYKAERAALALAAEEGDLEAAAKLDEVERELAAVAKAQGRAALAEIERARLADDAASERRRRSDVARRRNFGTSAPRRSRVLQRSTKSWTAASVTAWRGSRASSSAGARRTRTSRSSWMGRRI